MERNEDSLELEARVKLVLRLQGKLCPSDTQCSCCCNCTWILECYKAWQRGTLKRCRNRGVSYGGNPTWCSTVAKYLSILLEKPKVLISSPSLIEKWEDGEE